MLRSLSATPLPLRSRPRLPRRATAIVAMAAVVAVASQFAAQLGGQRDEQPSTSAVVGLPGVPAADLALESRQRIDGAIAVWTGNLDRDSGDFIAALHLGELYLNRA